MGSRTWLAPLLASVLLGGSARAQALHAQKVSQLEGGFGGTLNGGRFGTSLTAIDIDGDGIDELIVGEPRCHDGGNKRGALWVLFLGRDGQVRAQQKISHNAGGGQQLGLEDLFEFGFAVEALPGLDFLNDGKPNLEIGSPGAFNRRGGHHLISLNADGTLAASSGPNQGLGAGAGVRSYSAIAHDGFDNRAVGYPGANGGRGEVSIIYDSSLANCIYSSPIQTVTPLEAGDGFGAGLDWIGDLNGDGRLELVVASPGDDDGGPDRGAVRILSGTSCSGFSTLVEIAKISSTSGGFGPGLSDGDEFGAFGVTGPGDLDGDGLPDLIVGAPGDDDGGTDRGAFWRILLNADGTVKSRSKVSVATGGFNGALSDGDRFGHITAQDLDGDGVSELLVGAPFDDDGGTDVGAIWILTEVSKAAATARNGSGVNPAVYTSTSAILGGVWSAAVGHGPTARFTLVYGYRNGATGPSIAAGELLIDVTSPRLFRSLVLSSGSSDTHAAQVPSDVSLAGVTVATQGLILDPGTGPTLTNAIDLVVGGDC